MSCERLSWDVVVRAVDKELSRDEAVWVPGHIAECAECRRQYEAVEDVSLHIESAVNSVAVVEGMGEREHLLARLKQQDHARPTAQAPARVLRRFGWGMAIAATLAIGIIVTTKDRMPSGVASAPGTEATPAISNAIEVDGETFVALPYSNPDLPTSAPRIVQMQVPLYSLADIGIASAQVVSEAFNQDRTVLADVLLGADGQPLGVHVVSWD
jgi:hypothetical protein